MKQKDVLFILISACIVTLAWILFNVYHQSVSSKISESTNEVIQSINGRFDSDALKLIKERQHVDPLYTAPNVTPNLLQPANISPSASTSAVPSPIESEQQASQGGSLSQ